MDYNYSDNYEDKHYSIVFVYMLIIMVAVIIGVMALIFAVNKPKSSSKGYQLALQRAQSAQSTKIQKETEQVVKSVEELVSGSTLTSDQLDIWTLPDTTVKEKNTDTKNGTVKNRTTGEVLVEGKKAESDDNSIEESAQTSILSDSEDTEETKEEAKEITLIDADGVKQTIKYNDALEKNTYDVNHFTYEKPEMKYFVDGKQASTFGTFVSSKDKETDFFKMRRAGLDYAMIRIGQRGYSSGRLVMDSEYKNNLSNAKKAGLYLGAYFSSQAINKEEVLEEADAIISALDDYTITYPVMFDMEAIPGEPARTDGLDVKTRTNLALAFMKEIKEAGYEPILYGNLEWLLTKLDLEVLKDYDICVAQTGDTPEYPYQFQMWQYEEDGTLNGMEDKCRLLVNLKDYK